MLTHYELFATTKDEHGQHTYKYKLRDLLGKGAYANVYISDCIDTATGKVVRRLACKVIDPNKVSKEYEKKFLPRELDILRKVNHPHIIHLHAIYHSGQYYFIFMRYAENHDLLDFIVRTGEIQENQARLWTKQIALALQYLHELEIAHRDIKCENILVTANYNIKVADLGFARFLLSKKGHRILSETYCGSTSYAAPEIIKKIPYDPKPADVWSLGVVIYVMMNKALPFKDTTIRHLFLQQMNRNWKFRPKIAARTTKQVKELLEKVLEPEPEFRYTITEVLESEWLYMDPRIFGMTDQERFALMEAKDERREMF